VIYIDGIEIDRFLTNRFIFFAIFIVPSNVEKFGFTFARAIRFNFKEHLRLSNWIESKMFGSPPEDG
jgi:hypothetical protein